MRGEDEAAPLIRTLRLVPRVAGLEGFKHLTSPPPPYVFDPAALSCRFLHHSLPRDWPQPRLTGETPKTQPPLLFLHFSAIPLCFYLQA